MSQSQDFSAADYQRYWSLTPEERREILQDERVPVAHKALLLLQEGLHLAEVGKYEQAIASYNQALEFKPDYAEAWYNRGLALFYSGRYKEAVGSYDKAIALQPEYYEALCDRGHALSFLRRYKEGLANCDRALKIKPDYSKAWFRRGYILSLLGRQKEGLASCDKALELQPDSHEAWTSRGAVLAQLSRYQEALTNLDKALDIQPDYAKAWYNRGLVLWRLGRNEAALASFEKSLEIQPNGQEYWYSQAWYARGFMLARFGRYENAIASFERALDLKPDYPAAALYKLLILLLTGRIFNHIINPTKRENLFSQFVIILKGLKYVLLGILSLILVNTYAQGAWMLILKESLSILFSLGIIWLFIWELWKNRANLNFTWKVYFRSGILSYVRALGIVLVTLTTFAIVTPIVPRFMLWGWAGAVFGNSGNIIFQPFNTLQKLKSSGEGVLHANASLQPVTDSISSQVANIDYSVIFIGILWFVLILLVPFWAKLEEKIFRQGANSWKQISIRSILFGLVHIIVGIPIFAGFVLIVPGFLFACRYKYVHDKTFKKTQDEAIAQEAGVEASTADHAIYNAILITFFVGLMLM